MDDLSFGHLVRTEPVVQPVTVQLHGRISLVEVASVLRSGDSVRPHRPGQVHVPVTVGTDRPYPAALRGASIRALRMSANHRLLIQVYQQHNPAMRDYTACLERSVRCLGAGWPNTEEATGGYRK